MKVLVFGGTGFVGHSLVPLLRQHQHDVTALTRASPPRLATSGARLLRGDLLSPSVLGRRCRSLISLAAPRIFGKRLGTRRFAKLKAEMTTIYAHAIELARRRCCPIIITGGTAFKTSGHEVADETWSLVRVRAAHVGEEIDPLADRTVRVGTPKVVWMLPGQIYGPSGMFMMMYRMAKKGRSAIIGEGSNCIPRVHVDDCAAAYAAALDHIGNLATGERFIVADDVPCTQQQFAERLAELCHAPKPKSAPTFILKLILDNLLVETDHELPREQRQGQARAREWSPRYPGFREGLQTTVKAIERGEVIT